MSQDQTQPRTTPTQQQPNSAQAQANPQVAPHLLGFLGNPTLASAASAAPLFPGITMLNNPEALIGMSSMYPSQHAVQGGGGMVSNMPTMMDNQNGYVMAQPSHHLQQQQPHYLQQVLPNLPQHQQLAPNTATVQQMMSQGFAFQVPVPSTLTGVPMQPIPPLSSSMTNVKIAAASTAAAPPKNAVNNNNASQHVDKSKDQKAELTPQEKARQNRDRNREHARSTRLRKKAYVQKLKELVEGLHAERTEEVRKRRVAIQLLSEVQGVRRDVVRSFLQYHSNFESDPRKWSTIIEDDFWLRQPVTPYRCFRRAEVEQECRISRGIDAVIADAASLSVMVEGVGSRSSRWMQLKREEVLSREGARPRLSHFPSSIGEDSSQQQNGVSSLSSSSGSSNGSGGEEERQRVLAATLKKNKSDGTFTTGGPKQVSSSSGSSDEGRRNVQQGSSNDFHDYDAPALPDPMLGDSEGSPSDSPEESNGAANGAAGKRACTDSSSGEEEKPSVLDSDPAPAKRRKIEDSQCNQPNNATASDSSLRRPTQRSALPPNIALKGGISHSIRPIAGPPSRVGNGRLNLAPAVPLPPFVGIGKKATAPPAAVTNTAANIEKPELPSTTNTTTLPQELKPISGPTTVSSSSTHNCQTAIRADPAPTSLGVSNMIAPDMVTTSSRSSKTNHQIRAYYHVNEDDMLLTEDNLMCPFVFRTQGAVLSGALSECVMPGMLRCNFSQRNKLVSIEIVYDAMGFMQQLQRACGSDNVVQVVPGSLEMALAPNVHEARVITLAKYPFLIVSVNEAWTRTTKYTQMEVEGSSLNVLNGPGTSPDAAMRPGKPVHKFEEVAKGNCACSTNIHYDKEGRAFVAFVSSYPLTNSNDDVTHLLHVYSELSAPASPTHEFPESCSNESDSSQNQ